MEQKVFIKCTTDNFTVLISIDACSNICTVVEIQAETMTKINSIARNVHNKMEPSDLKHIHNIIQHYNNYKVHKNSIKYLTSIGIMYQGKNYIKLFYIIFCNDVYEIVINHL